MQKQNSLALPDKATATPVGLVLEKNLDIKEWLEIGTYLRKIHRGIQFWIGDWLNYGESKYGEMYAQAMDVSDYSYQALADMKYVAGQVEISRRRENVSWSIHREVASLSPAQQEKMLAKAENESMTVKAVRETIKEPPALPIGKYRISFYANGNTFVTNRAGVEQIPEFQISWFLLFIKFLKSRQVDPTTCDVTMPDGRKAKIVEIEGGSYNWEISK